MTKFYGKKVDSVGKTWIKILQKQIDDFSAKLKLEVELFIVDLDNEALAEHKFD